MNTKREELVADYREFTKGLSDGVEAALLQRLAVKGGGLPHLRRMAARDCASILLRSRYEGTFEEAVIVVEEVVQSLKKLSEL